MSDINLGDEIALFQHGFNRMWIQRYTSLKVQQFFDPYAGRNLSAIRNPLEDMGTRKDEYRVNCSPWLAMNDLVAGFSDGLTPRGRPFYEFQLPDPELMKDEMNLLWLKACRDVLLSLMDKSGFYDQIEILYRELATFGTAFMVVWEDMETGAWAKTYTFGEFVLALGKHGEPCNAWPRETMSVGRMEKEFGFDALPKNIQDAFTLGRTEDEWYVVNGMRPADYFDKSKVGEASMEYISYWFIEGPTSEQQTQSAPKVDKDNKAILREKRFRICPFVAPRWYAPGNQVYGTSPVVQVLGDIMQIQKMEQDKLIGEEKLVNPALMIPDSLRSRQFSARPGNKNFYAPPATPEQVVAVAGGVKYDVAPTAEEITNVNARIDRALFRDVFQSMQMLDPKSTAFQASKVWAEKMARIGPIIQVLQNKVLKHLVERYWDIAKNLGLLPPPPPNLPKGMELKTEYTSPLALALKQSAEMSALHEAFAITAELIKINPNAGMIWDFEETQRGVNLGLGLNPKFLHTPEVMAQMIQQQQQAAQQAQQAQQMQMLQQGSQAAQTLSQTQVGGRSVLDHLAGTQPSPQAA